MKYAQRQIILNNFETSNKEPLALIFLKSNLNSLVSVLGLLSNHSSKFELAIVNKYHYLSSSYVPDDLVTISSKYSTRTNKLRSVAAKAFENMAEDALKDNIKVYAASSYRSYSDQKYIYNNYVKEDGVQIADTYSARAGHSEHQTGLATDIADTSYSFIKDNTKESNWLKENAHKYGFILRYESTTEKITGYMYEPWHYRYVGVDIATFIHENKITYDEYVARNK